MEEAFFESLGLNDRNAIDFLCENAAEGMCSHDPPDNARVQYVIAGIEVVGPGRSRVKRAARSSRRTVSKKK